MVHTPVSAENQDGYPLGGECTDGAQCLERLSTACFHDMFAPHAVAQLPCQVPRGAVALDGGSFLDTLKGRIEGSTLL